MKKTTITSIAALTLLLGTSVAAFASSDRYEHRSYRGDDLRGTRACQAGGKACKVNYRRYRNHERHEYRNGHDHDRYKYNGNRRWRYDD